MVTLADIIAAYKYGRDNNRRSPDQVEFELHWQARCIRIYEAIVSKSFQPTAYTFMIFDPCPREIFASSMDTRILHYYLDMRLRAILERNLSSHTWNNRVGKGTLACQNAVAEAMYEVSQGYTQEAYIIKIDCQGCFPNINQDIAYNQLRELIEREYEGADKDELLYILAVCIFSYPTHHCERRSPLSEWDRYNPAKSLFAKPDGIGAAIGHLIWQNAVNYYFNDIDKWLDSLGIRYERYVDDVYIVTNSKAFLLLLPEMRRRYEELGAKLHPTKFYCQPVTHGVECLGRHIKMDRVYPNNRAIRRALKAIRRLNKRVGLRNIAKVISTVNSYLGICKNGQGYNQAMRIIECIDKRWFDYVELNNKRLCLQLKPEFGLRNQIIHKYNIL